MTDKDGVLRPSFTERVKQWSLFKRVIALFGAVAAIFALLILVVIPFIGGFVDRGTEHWLKDARHGGAAEAPTLAQLEGVPPSVQSRLRTQLSDVQNGARYHLNVTKAFFRYHYVTLTIAASAAVLAGLLLVPISWVGWKEADMSLKLTFLIFGGIAALFTTYSQIYSQSKNVSANAALYYAYLQLEDELLSYAPRLEHGDTTVVPPVMLIKEVDARLGTLRSFAIELDASRVPVSTAIAQQLSVQTPATAQ